MRRWLSFTPFDGLLLLMVLIWGANYSVVKAAINEIPPQAFNVLRMGVASAVFAAAIAATGLPRVARADWPRLALLGAIGHFASGNACPQAASRRRPEPAQPQGHAQQGPGHERELPHVEFEEEWSTEDERKPADEPCRILPQSPQQDERHEPEQQLGDDDPGAIGRERGHEADRPAERGRDGRQITELEEIRSDGAGPLGRSRGTPVRLLTPA